MAKKKAVTLSDGNLTESPAPPENDAPADALAPSNDERLHEMLMEIYDPTVVKKSAEAQRLIDAKKKLDVILGLAPEGGHCRAFGTAPFGGANIVGTEIHLKRREGLVTQEFCIVVYVKRKAPEGTHVFGRIPSVVDDVPTDVVVVGNIHPHSTNCGGVVGGTPGTMGRADGTIAAQVKCGETGDAVFVLSNQHVLNPSGFDNNIQPGLRDVTAFGQKIAELATWTDVDHPTVDAALAVVTNASLVSSQYLPTPTPPQPSMYHPGTFTLNPSPMSTSDVMAAAAQNNGRLVVKKLGNITGLTVGLLNPTPTAVDSTGEPQLGVAPRSFQQQWMITSSTTGPFSFGGDSGSLIVDASTNRPVALLWGGNGSTVSYANQIELVANVFGINRFL